MDAKRQARIDAIQNVMETLDDYELEPYLKPAESAAPAAPVDDELTDEDAALLGRLPEGG